MDGPARSYPQGYAIQDLGPPEDGYEGDPERRARRGERGEDPRYCHHGDAARAETAASLDGSRSIGATSPGTQ